MDPLKFSVENHEKYVYLKLDEEKLNTNNSPQLKSEFVTVNALGKKHIIVDLQHVQHVDSSGLSALLVAKRLFENAGGSFIVCGLTPHVQKLVEISQLHTVLNIVLSKQEGIEAVFMAQLQDEVEDDELGSEIKNEFGGLEGAKD